jgi:DNA-binding CsgD family transcriptional regulator
VAAYQGQVVAARKIIAEGIDIAERTGSPAPLSFLYQARGFLELSLGDAEAAHAALQPIAVMAFLGPRDPGVVRFLRDEIEALIRLGRLDDADSLLDTLQERAEAVDRISARAAAHRCRGMLIAARGSPGAALAEFDLALEQHDRIDQPFERGRTLLARGTIERRLRRKRAARESLHAALEVFERLGTPLWAEKARAELARIGTVRGEDPHELTRAERQVAELAAQGRTNREIADQLFMAPKTVEAHMSRILHKLGLRSRTELAATFAGSSETQDR